jgi:hypothetical protein
MSCRHLAQTLIKYLFPSGLNADEEVELMVPLRGRKNLEPLAWKSLLISTKRDAAQSVASKSLGFKRPFKRPDDRGFLRMTLKRMELIA